MLLSRKSSVKLCENTTLCGFLFPFKSLFLKKASSHQLVDICGIKSKNNVLLIRKAADFERANQIKHRLSDPRRSSGKRANAAGHVNNHQALVCSHRKAY